MGWPSADPTSNDLTAPGSRPAHPGLAAVTDELEEHRPALTAYCRRRLGSPDAEDAVQETFVRALRSYDRFEGRGTLRAWLHRIAANVCMDMIEGRKRAGSPMDLGPPHESHIGVSSALTDVAWIARPGGRVDPSGDPAEISASREAVERALAAALRYLPPRQRGVLILREVLGWRASEVAFLLGTSVASVNSTLQRARATLETRALTADAPVRIDEAELELLSRYIHAFERYDVDALTRLVHDDARGRRPVAQRADLARLEAA